MQTITTPDGGTMVILPLAEYEALLDAADIADADRVRRDIAEGRDEAVPAEIVARLIAGEKAIRVWREHRGLNSAELARRSDLSAPFLHQIETGKRQPSVAALKRIAEALGVDLDDLAD